MSEQLPKVVLDTVVLVQALISGRGPAAGCLEQLRAGKFILLTSAALLAEARDVPLRPELSRKYSRLTNERVEAFLSDLEARAVSIPKPPNAFTLPRYPKDEPLIDLAVAGNAQYLVTWNARHLTYLMQRDTPEGEAFCATFPGIRIVDPPMFLSLIRNV